MDLISQDRDLTPDPWKLSFYLYDGTGSVRALTDSLGAVTDEYDYTAFGEILRQSGTTSNNYRFQGEQFDPDTGLYYLRARWMNPGIGRFQTMDDFEGERHEPLNLHRYIFGNANPVNNRDPLGLFAVASAVAPTGINVIQPKVPASVLKEVAKIRTAVEDLLLSDMGERFIKFQEAIGGRPNLTTYTDSNGHKTIGYGHRLIGNEMEQFKKGITREKAQEIFIEDTRVHRNEFLGVVSGSKFYQNEFDAILSFVFNVGLGPRQRGWRIWGQLKNEENFPQIPQLLISTYSKDNPVRRKDEATLFGTGVYQFQGRPF